MRTLFVLLFLLIEVVQAQDTLIISYNDFLQKGIEFAPLLKAEQEKINTSLSKVKEVKANRFIPKFDITTNHGVMPGVSSPAGLPRDEWHLDPNLKNEWSDWSIFTQVQFSVAQPVFTWGALSNAINASKAGADVVVYQTEMKQADYSMNLTKLYFSMVLANQLSILADEAVSTINKAKKELDNLDDDSDIEEKELFKFKIYEQQFLIKAEEIYENKRFVQYAINMALGTKDIFYKPTTDSLSQLNDQIALPVLELEALANRSEIKAINSASNAVEFGVKAQKAQRLPLVYFGLGGEYVHTPRPVTSQPLIGTRFDYLNVFYSFGIRQSLNFGVMNAKVEQLNHQLKQAELSKDAVGQAILFDVSTAYKDFKIANIKKSKLSAAFQTSKEWLRKEQIDYDLGLGEIKNLVEAMKMNLELEAEFKQSQYELSVKEAMLLKAIGKLN
ncbi:TolC family protein [bacterium]|nr:MAG: TolC family protein [bacterium]